MSENSIPTRAMWSTRLVFILAAVGSAVGLGNIWKFPYMAGQNGGGAFVLFYLACVALVGLPIMIAEVLIGQRGRRNPIATMRIVGEEEGSHPTWGLVGVITVVGWLGGMGGNCGKSTSIGAGAGASPAGCGTVAAPPA